MTACLLSFLANPMHTLRLATPDDVPVLREHVARSVRSLSTGLYTPAQVETALAHVVGIDTQLVADQTYFVVDGSAGIVAAGGWSARDKVWGGDQAKQGADAVIDPASAPARIRAFFVHPDWTRRGLARQIYDACEHAARTRGFRAFELVAMLPGVPLFSALGFVALEPMSIPMPDGLALPCVRMHRAID